MTRRRFLGLGAAACMGVLMAATGCTSGNSQGSGSSASAAVSSSSGDELSTELFAFDTVVSLRATCDQATLDAAAERCEYFESIFSRTIETSDIGRINAAGGKPVEVAPETAEIITRSLEYSKQSEGLFDISIGTVTSLWDFAEGVKPKDKDIKAALPHIDYTKIKVDGTTVTLADPDMKLDLGGIAKGYIADDLAGMFTNAGCTSALINLGGNVMCVGKKPDGSNWRVGVQDPNADGGDVIAKVVSDNPQSVVTSGLYERKFEVDGTLYYHILDPKTGYPVKTDLVSSTVLSEHSIDGDANATILFLLGHDKALERLNSTDGFSGMLVDDKGNTTLSDGCPIEVVS